MGWSFGLGCLGVFLCILGVRVVVVESGLGFASGAAPWREAFSSPRRISLRSTLSAQGKAIRLFGCSEQRDGPRRRSVPSGPPARKTTRIPSTGLGARNRAASARARACHVVAERRWVARQDVIETPPIRCGGWMGHPACSFARSCRSRLRRGTGWQACDSWSCLNQKGPTRALAAAKPAGVAGSAPPPAMGGRADRRAELDLPAAWADEGVGPTCEGPRARTLPLATPLRSPRRSRVVVPERRLKSSRIRVFLKGFRSSGRGVRIGPAARLGDRGIYVCSR